MGDENSVQNFLNALTRTTLDEAAKAALTRARGEVEKLDVSNENKSLVVNDLTSLTTELQAKPMRKSRIARCWQGIQEIAPTIASILKSAESVKDILG